MKVEVKGQVPWEDADLECTRCESKLIATGDDRPKKQQSQGRMGTKYTFECPVCGEDVVVTI